MKKYKVLVVNGPNLNLLGVRERQIYGNISLDDINKTIKEEAEELNIAISFFQSNSEGQLIDAIHNAINEFQGIIINPGAYTHYSIAIRDAISSVNLPTIEVHISNIYGREEFRSKSIIAPVCIGQISGFKEYSYILALKAMRNFFDNMNGGM